MRNETTRRKTVDLCHWKEDDGSPCPEKVTWKLRSEVTGKCFKICDLHLAWGLRASGLPAYVDAFCADPETPTKED